MKKSYKIAFAAIVAIGAIAFITKDTPEEKEAKYLRRGNEYFEKGEFRKARIEYKNALKIKPIDPEIAYRWGLVDEAEGDIRNAYANFTVAEQQDPHYAPALLKIAHYLLVVEQNEEAKKRIDAVLDDSPDNAEAHALRAAMMLREKDFAGTEKEARFALSKEPGNVTAISVLTGLYAAKQDLPNADKVLEEGIKLNPKETSLLILKAKLHESPLNLKKIEEAYQSIFAIKPNDPQFRIDLADIFVNAKMLDQAEATLRTGITALKDDANLKHRLVAFLNQFRSYEAAEKEINNLMQANPQNDDFYFWLADLYITHNDIDKAIALLEKIISKSDTDKQSLNARTSLARINFVKGNRDKAKTLVDAVLKKSPNNRDALFIRASMESDLAQYENAVSDLRAILRDQPKSKDALQLLSEILLVQGYTDLAIETANQLLDVDPLNPAVRTRLAQMYNLNNDTKRALDMLSIVTKTNPQYAIGWESTARIAINMKDYNLAKDALKKLDAIEGQHMTVVFLEAQIAESSNQSEAFESYTKVISADPSAPLAEHALFSLVEQHHSPKELEQIVNFIGTLKTDSPYVSTILGQCYLQLQKNDLAAAAFDKAIANNPITQDAFINRAKLYMTEKKADEAIELLKKATIIAPADFRAPFMQGEVINSLGQHKEAVILFAELVSRNPKMDLAANNMASIIADHLYTDPAMLENARQATERFASSNNPLLLDTIGWVYYRMGKLDQALPLFAKAVSYALPTDKLPLEVHYHYGAALLKNGNKDQAKTELSKAVADGASYPALEEAKALLNGIKQ